MAVTVPYTFQNTANGLTLPLAELDANFNALALAINGPQTVSPSMLTAGGPSWNASGDLAAQRSLIIGPLGNLTSAAYPTNTLNIGVNGFTFNVNTSNPFNIVSTGATVNGILYLHSSVGGTVSVKPPQTAVSTVFTLPPDMGLAGYFLTTDGNGNTSWVPRTNSTVTSFSAGATGLTPVAAATGAIVLDGILNVAHGGTGTNGTPGAGQLLIGNGTKYVLNNLTAGPGVTITNGTGSITIDVNNQNWVNSVSGGTTGMTFTPSTGAAVLSGTLQIGNGGTGAPNAQTALNNLVGATTNNMVVKGNGANIVLAALSATDVAAAGTLTNNTSGSAATFTSTSQNSQFNSIGVGVAASATAGTAKVNVSVQTPIVKSNTAVTPPVFQDSAGAAIGILCRAWVNFAWNGTAVVVNGNLNVAVSRVSAGIYTLTFTNAMPNTSYAIIGCATGYNQTGANSGLVVCEYAATNNVYAIKTTTSVQISTIDNNTNTFVDPFSCNIAVFA